MADYIVAQSDAGGESIDLPKLQALLYPSQACNLAITGQPMFDEPILASPDGPYIESVAVRWAVTQRPAVNSMPERA
ncbi:Panacea domain-containing protein [Nakamurella panacisegetis]|uniref:hypothetical protein n=1 Tax=Nakamurella panacisegetis TaxID=1090615 RepID=UPI000B83D577|nr:hypothetical protein [Nakamurella panacisegetis]